jgi:hypothetical protein
MPVCLGYPELALFWKRGQTVVHNLLRLERIYFLMKRLLAVHYYNYAYLFCEGVELGMLGKRRTLAEEDLEQDEEFLDTRQPTKVKMRK